MIKSIKYTATTPVILQAIELYKSGMAIKPISKQLHVDGATLVRILKEEGLLRTRAQAVRLGKTDSIIKEDVLDILTPEALYWIGFLYSDGHIEKPPRKRISLTLSEVDISHLEKFASFFGEGLSIKNVSASIGNRPAPGQKNFGQKYYRVNFSNEKIYNRLVELGFTHNKTLSLIPHDLLKYSRDFFRGVVDGDGWISSRKLNLVRETSQKQVPVIGLSGTEDTLKSFMNFIRLSGINSNISPYKDKRANVWKVDISSANAKKIVSLLYKGASVYLERKYQKAMEILGTTEAETADILL